MAEAFLRYEVWHLMVGAAAVAGTLYLAFRATFEAGRTRGKLEAPGEAIREAARLGGENAELRAENKRITGLYDHAQGRLATVAGHLTNAIIAAEDGRKQ